MKLYYTPGACSLSPHIVLNELGLAHGTEMVDLKTKKTASGKDYNAITPKGCVPALVLDNGELLTEGPAIVQYLANLVPAKKLVPENGTMASYRLQEWLNYLSAELHKGFGGLFNPAMSDDMKGALKTTLGNRLGYVAQQLAGKDFLLGSEFSVADAYLFTILGWGSYVGIDIGQWPALKAYHGKIFMRPAVQATLKAEGLIPA
jgi:glutathione S-transferase